MGKRLKIAGECAARATPWAGFQPIEVLAVAASLRGLQNIHSRVSQGGMPPVERASCGVNSDGKKNRRQRTHFQPARRPRLRAHSRGIFDHHAKECRHPQNPESRIRPDIGVRIRIRLDSNWPVPAGLTDHHRASLARPQWARSCLSPGPHCATKWLELSKVVHSARCAFGAFRPQVPPPALPSSHESNVSPNPNSSWISNCNFSYVVNLDARSHGNSTFAVGH